MPLKSGLMAGNKGKASMATPDAGGTYRTLATKRSSSVGPGPCRCDGLTTTTTMTVFDDAGDDIPDGLGSEQRKIMDS